MPVRRLVAEHGPPAPGGDTPKRLYERVGAFLFEQRLDPARFARIHRYTIVRIDCVKDIVQELHGDFSLSLKNGVSLRLSRHYRSRLQL